MNVEIAQRLAARRKQAGLSQEALAEQLGVSRQAVSKWERSESSPDTDNLIALAQLYGLSLDELLYVEDELRDDVAFEAADRAVGCQTAQGDSSANSAKENSASTEDSVASCGEGGEASDVNRGGVSNRASKVRIGLGGIHVLDGDDYVHVSWRDGVHVKDSKKGDEVHVGWSGIHVKESGTTRSEYAAAEVQSDAEGRRDGSHGAERTYCEEESKQDGARRKPEGEWFGATNEGFGGRDDEGNEVVVDGAGVTVNGEHFDDWHDARERYGYGHLRNDCWYEPCGYTVNGERFNSLDDARAKYGPEVGRTIPVRKHYLREFEKSWVKFPYPLVIIVVYLLLGILNGAWGVGLFLFLTIPVYYMVGHAVGRRRIAPLISGVYPIAVVAWFCYMAFMLNQPHPAWVAFLTIPLVEWLVHSLSRWWRGRKRAKVAANVAPIDVDAQ
ncbi:MAG: helix-turn-helix transcriptional regulator [Gordonibacter sp.]|nr:helix-turn-helix transcriptional regulator [Gordonibacter sp.]